MAALSLSSASQSSLLAASSASVAAALPADQMSLEMMKVQMQMLQLQLKLKESEAGAKAAEAALLLKLKDKDIEIARVTAIKKTDIYEVQLKDIANQEVGLDDKISSLQRQLKTAKDELETSPLQGHATKLGVAYLQRRRFELPGAPEYIKLISESSFLEKSLEPLLAKRQELTTRRAAIYAQMK